MKTTAEEYEEEVKKIDLLLGKIKSGDSLNTRIKMASRNVLGYSQTNSVERAFGVKHSGELAFDNHLVTFRDIEYSIRWLMEQGYEITKQ